MKIKFDGLSKVGPAQVAAERRRTGRQAKMSRLHRNQISQPTLTVGRAALRYARLGLPVLPLHGISDSACTCTKGVSCSNAGKHPRCVHGVSDATTDKAVIRAWFKKWPDSNVGIATGSASSLVVLDVDPRNGGRDSLIRAKQAHGPLPTTWTVATGGGGQHIFFRAPQAVVKTSHGKRLGEGIDVQSDGVYVVAPPSRHVSGRCYAWAKGKAPDSTLAKLPQAYRRAIQGKRQDVGPASKLLPEVSHVREGHRNNHLTSMGGKLVAAGMKGSSLISALLSENAALHPPLPIAEVEKIAASVSRYDANEAGDEAERIAKALIADRFSRDEDCLLIHAPDGQFWAFEDTHWRPAPGKWLAGVVLGFVQTWPGRKATNTSGLIRQVIALLEAMTATKEDVLRFNADPPPVINCVNGELWIREDGSVQLKPHAPNSFLRHALPVNYDPTATCSRFDGAVAEIFSKAPESDSLVRFWNELAGYAIQPARSIPLVVICKGGGSNGKTALMETLVRLVGRDLVAAMAVDDLEKSRFTIGSLLGKQLFLDDDVKSGTKLPDGNLKRLSEAKTVTGEHKFGQPFTFTVRTLPVLLCNNPPSLSDLTHGMRRRLVVIPFDRTFEGKEVDKALFPAIWKDEMSGVLNRCLEGLRRVVKRGWQLSNPTAIAEAKDAWLIEANPLPAFIDECCKTSGSIFVQDLYEAYTEWTKSRGITLAQQRTSFDRNLESCGFRFAKKGNRGKRVDGLTLRTKTTTPF